MDKKLKVLVVIDVQNDFVSGSLGTEEAKAIVPRINDMINSDEYEIKVFTLDTHDSSYLDTLEGENLPIKHCIKGTWGWEPAFDLSDVKNNQLIEKNQFGTLTDIQNTIMDKMTEYDNTRMWPNKFNVESITIVGLCTDICVISNALILKSDFTDIPIICDASACAGSTPEKHRAALEVMRSCQIQVIND